MDGLFAVPAPKRRTGAATTISIDGTGTGIAIATTGSNAGMTTQQNHHHHQQQHPQHPQHHHTYSSTSSASTTKTHATTLRSRSSSVAPDTLSHFSPPATPTTPQTPHTPLTPYTPTNTSATTTTTSHGKVSAVTSARLLKDVQNHQNHKVISQGLRESIKRIGSSVRHGKSFDEDEEDPNVPQTPSPNFSSKFPPDTPGSKASKQELFAMNLSPIAHLRPSTLKAPTNDPNIRVNLLDELEETFELTETEGGEGDNEDTELSDDHYLQRFDSTGAAADSLPTTPNKGTRSRTRSWINEPESPSPQPIIGFSTANADNQRVVPLSAYLQTKKAFDRAKEDLQKRESDLRMAGELGEAICAENTRLEGLVEELSTTLEQQTQDMKLFEEQYAALSQRCEHLSEVNLRLSQEAFTAHIDDNRAPQNGNSMAFEDKSSVIMSPHEGRSRSKEATEALQEFIRGELANNLNSSLDSSLDNSMSGASPFYSPPVERHRRTHSYTGHLPTDVVTLQRKLVLERRTAERQIRAVQMEMRRQVTEMEEMRRELESNLNSSGMSLAESERRRVEAEANERRREEEQNRERALRAELNLKLAQIKKEAEREQEEMRAEIDQVRNEERMHKELREIAEHDREAQRAQIAELLQRISVLENEKHEFSSQLKITQDSLTTAQHRAHNLEEELLVMTKSFENELLKVSESKAVDNDTHPAEESKRNLIITPIRKPSFQPQDASPAFSTSLSSSSLPTARNPNPWSLWSPDFELSTEDYLTLQAVHASLCHQWKTSLLLLRSNVTASLPEWVPDLISPECLTCHKPFGFANRRHHCRLCGGVFCSGCAYGRRNLLKFNLIDVRVCQSCHTIVAVMEHGASILQLQSRSYRNKMIKTIETR